MKEEKMRKYFMKGTNDEIKFGDMLELDFTKERKHGMTHHHMECRFIPELVDILLENDLIEVREPKKKCEKPLEFVDRTDIIEEMQKAIAELEDRIIDLEETVAELTEDE